MKHTTTDVMLTTCGTCAVLAAGAAFASLLYVLISAAVPLVETLMSQPLP